MGYHLTFLGTSKNASFVFELYVTFCMFHVSFSDPSESVALQKNPNLWEGFRDKYLESKLWYSQSTGCPFGYIPQSLVVTNTVLLMGWLLTSLAVSSPSSLQIHVCLNAVNIKFILNKEMKQPLSPRDVFLGHTLFVAPPQLSSLLHCTAGFPTSTTLSALEQTTNPLCTLSLI